MDVLSLTDASARLGFIAQTLALGRLRRPEARARPGLLAQTPK